MTQLHIFYSLKVLIYLYIHYSTKKEAHYIAALMCVLMALARPIWPLPRGDVNIDHISNYRNKISKHCDDPFNFLSNFGGSKVAKFHTT